MILRSILIISIFSPKLFFGQEIFPLDQPVENNDFVHRKGTKILDGDGNQLYLTGTIVLGWLQWEGTIWDCGLTSEKKIKTRITELVGKEEFEKFQLRVYEDFFTEKDIAAMKKLGFNTVRIPFNHTILEDDENPYHYKESGWNLLDSVIARCERNQLYVVLDMHSAPGGQSGILVADPDKTKLWQSEENKKRTVALWKAIAERYKDKKIIAGFDLLNEPGFPKKQDLVDLYIDIIRAVREVDQKHLLFIEGNGMATDFSVFKAPLSQNMAYSYHTYNLLGRDKSRKHLQHLIKIANEQNIPIWNGEFGANTVEWTKETVDLFKKTSVNCGWIYWPWKRIPASNTERYAQLYGIKSSENWNTVKKYIAFKGNKPDRNTSLKGLQELLEAISFENCTLNDEMGAALSGN